MKPKPRFKLKTVSPVQKARKEIQPVDPTVPLKSVSVLWSTLWTRTAPPTPDEIDVLLRAQRSARKLTEAYDVVRKQQQEEVRERKEEEGDSGD